MKQGAPWKLVFEDGRVADAGEVLEVEPPGGWSSNGATSSKPELREEEGFSPLRDGDRAGRRHLQGTHDHAFH